MNSNNSPTHMRLVIQEDQLNEGAIQILETIRPKWNKSSVVFKLFTDGYTNKLMGCYNSDQPDDVILIRVYGPNTDLIIDRKSETRNIRTLHAYGYAPRLYATFGNGLAYEYMPGEILTVDSVQSPDVFPLIADLLAKIHRVDCGPDVSKTPTLWTKLRQFLGLVPETYEDAAMQDRFLSEIPHLDVIEKELSLLERTLSALGSPVVFCHNDLLLANVLHDADTKSVKFIDYEYASYNYQAYDIANHFAEMAGMAVVDFTRYPTREFQWRWLRIYLESYNTGEDITDAEVDRLYVHVNKFSLVTHFFWGIWALVQAKHSRIDFDFIGFSSIRMKEYFLRKNEFLSLQVS